MTKNPLLPPPPIRHALCAEAMISEPTLRKFFIGKNVQPNSAMRIQRAAKVLGMEHLLPQPTPVEEG